MRILWSLPVCAERLGSGRGDLVRAKKLIDAMRGIGHEVHAVEFGTPAAVSTYRKILRRILPRLPAVMLRDLGRWSASFKHAQRVSAQAVQFGADVIVETQVGFFFSGAIAAQKTGLPLVLDDCSPSREETILKAGLPWLARDAMRRQAQAAALVVATSLSIAKNLEQEGVPGEKIRLIPNGVNLKAYAQVDRENMRQQMHLEDYCVIGFAGSFQPWHATRQLVEALYALVSNSCHLMLVGDGPTLATTVQAARSLGLEARISTTGGVHPDRVPELISCFDIGVLPGSNDYGHPMKLIEYAAAGAAVVAPDLQPVRELIHNMKTGLLFTPGNLKELVDKLQMLICNANLRLQMGNRARRSLTYRDDWCGRARELGESIELLFSKNHLRCQANSGGQTISHTRRRAG